MSKYTLQHTCFLILLSFFVDQGHGRWKPSRDKLQKDIELYKQMTKKMKQELEAYYDKYSDDPFDDYYLGDNKYLESQIHYDVEKNIKYDQSKHIPSSNKSNVNETQLTEAYDAKFTGQTPIDKNNILSFDKKWPKFEDILLAIGKKYDWKNDRWIKIKHKNRTQNKLKNNINHQKHNFIYRIVKLNRAKSKRNVVIAVTAVR